MELFFFLLAMSLLIVAFQFKGEGIITTDAAEDHHIPPRKALALLGGQLSARSAFDGEVELAKKVGTLIHMNEQVALNLPKLKEVFDGADIRHQKRTKWCAIHHCAEGGPEWPGDTFERRTLTADEVLAIISSFSKFDYFQETVQDGKVFRFHQLMLEYDEKFYLVTVHSQLYPNLIVKSWSAIQNLTILQDASKIEFVNVADEDGTLEMEIPREAFHEIVSISINHINSDFILKKNSTHFNVQIKYPEGNNDIEIFGLDTETPIIFQDPELLSKDSSKPPLSLGNEVVVQSLLRNNMERDQSFVYILQVKDSNDFTVFMDTAKGLIGEKESLHTSLKWTPDLEGQRTIETFLWNNLETPIPLSSSKRIHVEITL